jgi:hypothetical protein
MVRTAGLEPAQGFPQGILSPLRLPFRHVRDAHTHTMFADAHSHTMPAKVSAEIDHSTSTERSAGAANRRVLRCSAAKSGAV